MARRTKFTPEIQQQILDNLRIGCTIEVTCALVGIDETTFYKWQKHEDKVEFFQDVRRAQAYAHRAAVAAVRASLAPTTTVTVETETFEETRLRRSKAGGDEPYMYHRTVTVRRETTAPADWRAGIEYLKRRDARNWSDKIVVSYEEAWEQAVAQIKGGLISYEALAAEDEALAKQLFQAAGVPIKD